jgi:hypothetical protein
MAAVDWREKIMGIENGIGGGDDDDDDDNNNSNNIINRGEGTQ